MKNTIISRGFTMLSLLIILCGTVINGSATTWTTVSAGSINTLSNWSDGSTSPTTFATPGDTWNITMNMTMSSGVPWTVGMAATAPVTVNLMSGGYISGGAGGFQMIFNIYGNMNVADTIIANGGACKLLMNVWGNYTQTSGMVEALGGGAILVYNINGDFSMSDGSVISQGGAAIDTFYIKGGFSMSGPSYLACIGGSASGVVYLSLPSSSGTMLIDNTSTGAWSSNSVYINSNCTAQLAGNFGFSSPNTLTVNGTLICPAAYTVNGVGKFDLASGATLTVGHPTGINGAVVCSGTRVFSNNANYGFNGTAAQVTGTDMPATLVAPDTLTISNAMGVTLSQTTSSTGFLRFTSGVLHTGANTITLPGAAGSVSGAGLTNYVEGTLIKTIAGLANVNYEVGDTSYAPMSLALSAPGTAGSLGIKVNNGLHPNVATSGLLPAYMTTHYWTVTNLSAAGPATITPTATYNLSTIVSGSNYSFHTQKYNGSAWLPTPRVSTNTTSPYTTKPDTAISLASLAGDYIFGRWNNPTLELPSVSNTAELKIFPNPGNGSFIFSINTEETQDVQVIITDILGRKIKELAAQTNKVTGLEINRAPGIYLLTVTGKNISRSAKIIVE